MASAHDVHLFDDAHARVDAVSSFIMQAMDRGARAIVAARPSNWTDIARALGDGLVQSDRLLVLDARTTLALIMSGGHIDSTRFDAVLEPPIVEAAAASPVPVAIYGEMVDILASDGHFAAVTALEECWNRLLARVEVNLLCGYSSAHFATGDRRTLLSVCAAHGNVRVGGLDTLGGWLVRTSS